MLMSLEGKDGEFDSRLLKEVESLSEEKAGRLGALMELDLPAESLHFQHKNEHAKTRAVIFEYQGQLTR